MRRLALLVVMAILMAGIQLLVNCSNPLESSDVLDTLQPGPVVVVDTVVRFDTLIITDSTSVDTIIIEDTVFDTIFDTDTVVDTTVQTDTIIVTDTIADTIIDTVVDTIGDTVIDTFIDTVIDSFIDTIVDTSTDTVIDSIFDTITDTIMGVDTIVVVIPDTSDSPVVCARLNSYQQEIVWMFRNQPGQYHLEFVGLPDRTKPAPILTVNIDGANYEWNLAESTELILDRYLVQNAMINITRNKPNPFGHDIDICLTVTRP
jgi:hypothetical protein